MTPEDKRLELLRMLQTLDPERLTKEDFIKGFKGVIDYVKKVEVKTADDVKFVSDELTRLGEKVKSDTAADTADLKSSVRKEVDTQLSRIETEWSAKMKTADEKMRAVDDKLAAVVDGKDADETVIVDQVLSRMPTPLGGEDIRNVLEAFQGDDRLKASAISGLEELLAQVKSEAGAKTGWGAHPLAIAQSGTTKTKLARRINFTGATVTHNADGSTTVAVNGGGGFTELSATETPNAVVKIFTFSAASAQPSYLVVDNVWMKATTKAGTVNWTWSSGSKQATLTIAPVDDIYGIV